MMKSIHKPNLLSNDYGYDDCEHLIQLYSLRNVMFAKLKKKIGRGRKAEFIEMFKYNDTSHDMVRENIMYSIKIYEEKCSSLDNTNQT